MIDSRGNLVLMSQNRSVVWSASLTTEAKSSVVLQLPNSGNLVLTEEQDSDLGINLWQRFKYPSDTLLGAWMGLKKWS